MARGENYRFGDVVWFFGADNIDARAIIVGNI